MQFRSNIIFPAMSLIVGLFAATGANAALVGGLGGQAVNDTDLNITWIANANLAATNTFGLSLGVDLGTNPGVTNYGPSTIYSDGTMTWGGALKWIGAMNAANYLGYNDWRLPTSDTCSGYNICTSSELGHLFGIELGGLALPHDANYSLFSNLFPSVLGGQGGFYWSGTEYVPNTAFAWANQAFGGTTYQINVAKNYRAFALAVRSGQVTPVPIPAAAWLFGSGLLGLIGVARRKAA